MDYTNPTSSVGYPGLYWASGNRNGLHIIPNPDQAGNGTLHGFLYNSEDLDVFVR